LWKRAGCSGPGSAAKAGTPHARKLYYLYASDRDAYTGLKERADGASTTPPIRTLQVDGTWYRTGEATDLFVMTKVGPRDAPGTDDGWVYGVLTADGKELRATGRLPQCSGCHSRAPHGRLYGLPERKSAH
jgi:hypothetical protein